MFEVVIPLVLLANGLAAGVLVGTQLGGMPLLEALPPARYVHAHAFFSTRFDPFMPACLVATVLGDILLGIVAGTAQVAFFVAAVCALASMVISLVKNVPVNKWIRTLDPASLPGDFAERDPRRTWGGWNRARTYLVVLAMAANCVAVGIALAYQN